MHARTHAYTNTRAQATTQHDAFSGMENVFATAAAAAGADAVTMEKEAREELVLLTARGEAAASAILQRLKLEETVCLRLCLILYRCLCLCLTLYLCLCLCL